MGHSRLPAVAAGGTGGLARALTLTAGQSRSAAVAIAGAPGGVVHLSGGLVAAVTSPGAPDAAAVLLASGRLAESEWAALRRNAVAPGRPPGATELAEAAGAEVASIGPQELQVVCMMSALDAAFAIAAGQVTGSAPAPDLPLPVLSAAPGIDRDWLLQETERRLAALASLRTPLSPETDRVRVTTAVRTAELSDARRDILQYADGRHTPSDIARLLGRSLFAVTTELSRMAGEGLLQVAPAHPEPDVSGGPPADGPAPAGVVARLPLRRRGASRINEVLPLRPLADRDSDRSTDRSTDRNTDRNAEPTDRAL